MNIWVLTNEYEPYIIGGLGVVATHLTQALAKGEANVTVLTTGKSQQLYTKENQGLSLIRLPITSPYFSTRRRQFRRSPVARWLKENPQPRPDLIHIHSVQYAQLGAYYKKKYDIPLVYTCHSLVILERTHSALRKYVSRQQEELLRIADHIVVPSDWQKKKLEQFYPFCVNKIDVIENGVNVKETPPSSSRNHLLFIGRLVPMKGIEELLHAVAQLAKKQPSIKLDIAGTGRANYVAYLKSLTHRLHITSNVNWLGFQKTKDIEQLYTNHSAVIVPSRQESFGMVALEALAHRVPLVSTCAGGLSHFVTDDIAQIIPRVSRSDITHAIQTMWKKETLTLARIQKGLAVAMRYDWSIIAHRYQQLFHTHCTHEIQETAGSNTKWTVKKEWKTKRQGQVWIVKNEEGIKGYFKFTRPEQWYFSGPMVANETIAATLAQKLDLPVADLEWAEVRGKNGDVQKGIVSLVPPAQEVITWRNAGENIQRDPKSYVHDMDKLIQIVVFDAWIANIDRAMGKNLILYRNDPHEKYNWYLIDHGHTLYGSPRKWVRGKWDSPIWQQLWQFYHVPKGLLRLQSSLPLLEPMIDKIEQLSESAIEEALDRVPEGSLRKKERTFIKNLLLSRQKHLRSIISRWLNYKGTKEYGSQKK